MSWDVANIQSHVQLATGNDGLSSRVITWFNRTIMEIVTSGVLPKQIEIKSQHPLSTATNTTSGVDDGWTSVATDNIVALHHLVLQATTNTTAATSYYNPLVRMDVRDLYPRYHGLAVSQTGDPVENYANVKWTTYSAGSHMGPLIALALEPSNRSAEVHLYKAPDKATTAADTNWILRKYPKVVLAGVLRYAFIYLGNPARYQYEQQQFKAGVEDIIKNETGDIAHAPVMRGVVPGFFQRG